MARFSLNPFTLFSIRGTASSSQSVPAAQTGTSPPTPGTSQATSLSPTTSATAATSAEPVEGVWIDADSLSGGAASVRTEQFSRIVNSFDEDRQEWLQWLTGKFYTILAYVLPPVTAWYVGMAIGDAFAGAFTFASAWSIYAHFISLALEMALPMLGLAVVTTFKRTTKDKSQLWLLITLAVLFVGLGIGNAYAQIFLIEQHLTSQTVPAQVAMYFRAFAPLVIDVIASVYLSIIGVRNLKKYLADQREKITAVRDVNAVHIEMEATQIKAAIDRQGAIMDMQSKQQRAATWNQIEAMQSQAMIEQAKRNMDGDGGARRSRY